MINRKSLRDIILSEISKSLDVSEQKDQVSRIPAADYKKVYLDAEQHFLTIIKKHSNRVSSPEYKNKIENQLRKDGFKDEEISDLLDNSDFLDRIVSAIESTSLIVVTNDSFNYDRLDSWNGAALAERSEKSWAPDFNKLKYSIKDSTQITPLLSKQKTEIENFVNQEKSYNNPLILISFESFVDATDGIKGTIDHEVDHIQGSMVSRARKIIRKSPDEPETFSSTIKSLIKDPRPGGWDDWVVARFQGDKRAAFDFLKDSFQGNLDPSNPRGVEESRNRFRELNDKLGGSESALRKFLNNEISNPTPHTQLISKYGRKVAQVVPLINYELGIDELVSMIYGIASLQHDEKKSKIV